MLTYHIVVLACGYCHQKSFISGLDGFNVFAWVGCFSSYSTSKGIHLTTISDAIDEYFDCSP